MIKERKPNRLQGYDYSQNNLYFITSCVQNRVCCFGAISHGEMTLNDYGQIAEQQWVWLGEQYPYIVLHAFVVMPNHIHGIIEINRPYINIGTDGAGTGRGDAGNNIPVSVGTGHGDVGTGRGDVGTGHGDVGTGRGDVGTGRGDVGTGRDLSLQKNNPPPYNRDLSLQTIPKIKSLSELMGAYKTTVSKQIHLSGYMEFTWQRSFYDHIIRKEEAYLNIYNYIINNPLKWDQDEFYDNGK